MLVIIIVNFYIEPKVMNARKRSNQPSWKIRKRLFFLSRMAEEAEAGPLEIRYANEKAYENP